MRINYLEKSREYYPIIKKTDCFSNHVNGLIKNFFNGSASQFTSFFTKETNLSTQELEELKKVIDSQIKNNKNDYLHTEIGKLFSVVIGILPFGFRERKDACF